MQDDTRKTFAVLSVIFAVLAWFVLGIILAPLAVFFGIMGEACKEPGYKAAAIVGIVAGAIEFGVMLLAFAAATAVM